MRIGVIEDDGQAFLIHVHVVPESSLEVHEPREFRDRLRADHAVRDSYVAAKRATHDAGVRDNREYRDRKGEFIAALGYKGAIDA